MRLLNKHSCLFTRYCQLLRWYWIFNFFLDLSIQLVDMSLLYLDTIAFWQFRIKTKKHTFHNMQRSPLLKDNYLHKLCQLNTFNNKQLFNETEMHLFFKTRKTWISFPIKRRNTPQIDIFVCLFLTLQHYCNLTFSAHSWHWLTKETQITALDLHHLKTLSYHVWSDSTVSWDDRLCYLGLPQQGPGQQAL